MNPLYVGIDVSSKTNVVYLMKPDGSKISNFSVANSLDGSKKLVKYILSALDKHSLDEVVIGLESTSVYGENLVFFLREDGSLAAFPNKIHVLNPKQVKKFKDSYNDLPKNDFVDSYVIADCLRFGRINKAVYLDDYRYTALKTLTRARFYAVQNLVKEKQRMINIIFKKYSSLTQDKVFSDRFGNTAIAVYTEFDSVDTLVNMDLNDLTEFIKKKGKNRFDDPDAVAKALQKAARSSYRLPKTVNDSVNQVLSISINSIRATEAQIKALEKAIAEQMDLIPNTLQSIPGIGPVYAAGIIAEIGDFSRFDSPDKILAYAGMSPSTYQSGQLDNCYAHMEKRGSRYLRYALYNATKYVCHWDESFGSYLTKKRAEGKHYNVALSHAAKKLVRTIYAMEKSGLAYNKSV